ncbi:chromosome partitioning protein [Deinobacterium chartae]|uniref:Chromosome partitioning protein n=1 Tax=Deinobacterium chartae TaxID=521158 RepID=A0A841HWY1_9DEIO|nr:chromosome partitioning protein [Deinobacterium chartae]
MKVIALASDKGGVGKSTLALHLAATLHGWGLRVAAVDEDERVASLLAWAARGPGVGFPVYAPDDVKPKRLEQLDYLVIDTEGRPKFKQLLKLVASSDLVLVPSGVSALELEATLALLRRLRREGADLRRVRAVVTKAPPVGGGGLAARSRIETEFAALRTVLRAYNAYQRAAETGTTVLDLGDARADAARFDLSALAAEVTRVLR